MNISFAGFGKFRFSTEIIKYVEIKQKTYERRITRIAVRFHATQQTFRMLKNQNTMVQLV